MRLSPTCEAFRPDDDDGRMGSPLGASSSPIALRSCRMSRELCEHLSTKLADSYTCGARCENFPACLPPMPVIVRRTAPDLDATYQMLVDLNDALDRGLSRHRGKQAPYALLVPTSKIRTQGSEGIWASTR